MVVGVVAMVLLFVGTQTAWRMATPLPVGMHNPHPNGGCVFSFSWRILGPHRRAVWPRVGLVFTPPLGGATPVARHH